MSVVIVCPDLRANCSHRLSGRLAPSQCPAQKTTLWISLGKCLLLWFLPCAAGGAYGLLVPCMQEIQGLGLDSDTFMALHHPVMVSVEPGSSHGHGELPSISSLGILAHDFTCMSEFTTREKKIGPIS